MTFPRYDDRTYFAWPTTKEKAIAHINETNADEVILLTRYRPPMAFSEEILVEVTPKNDALEMANKTINKLSQRILELERDARHSIPIPTTSVGHKFEDIANVLSKNNAIPTPK